MNRSIGRTIAFIAVLGGAAILASSPRTANAQTVTISHVRQYQNPGSPGSPDINDLAWIQFDPTFSGGTDPSKYEQVYDYIGAQSVTLSGAGVPTGPFSAYCVDIPGTVGSTPYPGAVQSTSALSTGNPTSGVSQSELGAAVAWLYNNSVVTSDIDSAALQLAIWKTLYDWNGNPFSSIDSSSNMYLGSGNFQYLYSTTDGTPGGSVDTGLSVAIIKQADNYLVSWGGDKFSTAVLLHTTDVSSPDGTSPAVPRQDLVTNFSSTAPEPGTLALLAAAGMPAFGLIATRVRRRRV